MPSENVPQTTRWRPLSDLDGGERCERFMRAGSMIEALHARFPPRSAADYAADWREVEVDGELLALATDEDRGDD